MIKADFSKVQDFSLKLSVLSRSALPVAVRTALNSAAFDVKQNTMPTSAKNNFVNRSNNFFKANSRVEQAKGFDINLMESKAGFVEKSLSGSNNYAVKDLEQQDQGGTIKSKAFIPVTSARTSKSNSGKITPKNRLTGIKKIVIASKGIGSNDKQKFVRAVHAAGVGGYVLSEYKGAQILWRVNSINKTAKGNFKLTALYSYSKGRDIKVKPTHFMEEAANISAKKIPDYFVKAAKIQIKKAFNL